MSTVREALAAAIAELNEAGVPDAARDARRLMAHALAIAPDRLTLHENARFGPLDAERFDVMVAERCLFRPVAQIVGHRAFWDRDFLVNDSVLDPRPETETLIAAALAGPEPTTILDLGTGSGAIILTLLAEWPDAFGVGSDVDPAALAVAKGNARIHGIGRRRCLLVESDWYAAIEGRFDLVVSNPPYVSESEYAALARDVAGWEPRHALTPGPTGLEAYAAIAAGLAGVLAPGGRALFEIGPTQAEAVAGLFAARGFGGARIHEDLDGRDRVVEVGQ